jgi:hypothetical protein
MLILLLLDILPKKFQVSWGKKNIVFFSYFVNMPQEGGQSTPQPFASA